MNHFIKNLEFSEICKKCKENCCVGHHGVPLTNSEKKEIPTELIDEFGWLKIKLDDSSQNQHSCVAYKDGKCELYDKRPLICRLYPIQPVEVTTQSSRTYSDHTDEESIGVAIITNGCFATKELSFKHFERQVDEAIELFKKSGLRPAASCSIEYLERNRIKYRIIKRYNTK